MMPLESRNNESFKLSTAQIKQLRFAWFEQQIEVRLLSLLLLSAVHNDDREQLDLRDRRWFLRNFKRCFVASVCQGNISSTTFFFCGKSCERKHNWVIRDSRCKYVTEMREPVHALVRRWWNITTQEAVDSMLRLKLARTRSEAVLLGRQLVTVKWQCFVQCTGSLWRLHCWNHAWTD